MLLQSHPGVGTLPGSRLTRRIRDSKVAAGPSQLTTSSFATARGGPTGSDCVWHVVIYYMVILAGAS
jgi:hypothetical protein